MYGGQIRIYKSITHAGGRVRTAIFPKPLFSKNIRNNRTIGKKAFKIIHLYCSVSIVRNRTLSLKKEHCLNIKQNKDKLTGSQFVTLPIHHYQTHILCKQRVSIHSPFLSREIPQTKARTALKWPIPTTKQNDEKSVCPTRLETKKHKGFP